MLRKIDFGRMEESNMGVNLQLFSVSHKETHHERSQSS